MLKLMYKMGTRYSLDVQSVLRLEYSVQNQNVWNIFFKLENIQAISDWTRETIAEMCPGRNR